MRKVKQVLKRVGARFRRIRDRVPFEASLLEPRIRGRLGLTKLIEAPPPELVATGGSDGFGQIGLDFAKNAGLGDFFEQGQEFAGFLERLGGLRREARVLDIGCGAGRMAVPLLEYLNRGSYEGFDVNRDAIRWCRANITSRRSDFRFQTVSVHSDWYNPHEEASAGEFRFPYADTEFDFIFAASVFTHLLEPATKRYLAEIGRVLKPDGRWLCSFFLFPTEGPFPAPGWGDPPFWPGPADFRHERDGCRTENLDYPDKAVAYLETWLRREVADAGLAIDAIHPGYWPGRPHVQAHQDIVVGQRSTMP